MQSTSGNCENYKQAIRLVKQWNECFLLHEKVSKLESYLEAFIAQYVIMYHGRSRHNYYDAPLVVDSNFPIDSHHEAKNCEASIVIRKIA